MENRPATGLQVGFLVFAVLLLAVPFDKHVLGQWQWARDADLPTGRIANFLLGGLILLVLIVMLVTGRLGSRA